MQLAALQLPALMSRSILSALLEVNSEVEFSFGFALGLSLHRGYYHWKQKRGSFLPTSLHRYTFSIGQMHISLPSSVLESPMLQ
jgi:hypothetical protein